MDHINQPMKESLFNASLKPFLRYELTRDNHSYFMDQAWRLWILGFTRNDVEVLNLLQKSYVELYKKNPSIFNTITSGIYSSLHDKRVIIEDSMSQYYGVKDDDGIGKFKKGFEYYKSLYESEFSLWISPFIAYIYECFNPKLKTSAVDYLNLGAGNKLKTIEDQGFTIISDRLDRTFRNAGSGHESWEILDSGECIYKDIIPATGAIRAECKIQVSDLEEKIKNIELISLLLDLSVHIFLANNPRIKNTVYVNPTRSLPKLKEINRMISLSAKNFQLEVESMQFDRKILNLKLIHKRLSIGIGPSQMLTDKFACDIVDQKFSVFFIDQVLSLLFDLIEYNDNIYFDANIEIEDKEKAENFSFSIDKLSLEQWHSKTTSNKKKVYPSCITETILSKSYSLVIQHKIHYGYGKHVDWILKNPLFTYKYQTYILARYSFEE